MKCVNVKCMDEHTLKVNWPSVEYPTYFCEYHGDELHKRIKSLKEWMRIVRRAKGLTKASGWRKWHKTENGEVMK